MLETSFIIHRLPAWHSNIRKQVVSEAYKTHVHRGIEAALFHYRESRGLEIDLLVDHGGVLDAVEIKSGETVSADFFKNLRRFSDRLGDTEQRPEPCCFVLYGGDTSQRRSQARVLSWRDVERLSTGDD